MKKGVWAWVLLLSGGLLAADKTITGDYIVAAGGETYDNVTVSATAKVSGGTLTIADGGTLTVSSGTATFACAVAWGTSTDARVTLAPASGAEAVFTGKLTGPADVEIAATDRYGIVRFSPGDGVTNDFDGDLTVTRGTFRAKGDSALGSTAGTTTCICTMTDNAYDNFIYFDGLTTSETIYLSRGTVGWSKVYTICFTGDSTFNGPILSPGLNQEYGWKFSSGITLTFNGGLGTAESPFEQLMGSDDGTSNAEIVFNSSPYVNRTWYWMSGVNVMNAPLLGTCGLCFRGGTYRLNVSECFARESVKRLRFESAAALTLDLAAGPQTFSYLTENKSGYSASSVITSSAGQMFKLTNADHDSVYNGVFTGDVDFDVAGSKTVTLAGASTSAGTLTLSDTAKVVFAEGGSWAGGLAFAAGDGSQTVTLDNGGMRVAELWVGGVRLADGVYGAPSSSAAAANQLPCLSGTGLLTVLGKLEVSSGTYTVPEGGAMYSGVIVSGDAEITGGPLWLTDGAVVSVAAGKTARFTGPVTCGETADGHIVFAPASGAEAVFSGKLSGPAGLEVLAADKTGIVRFSPGDGVTNDFDGALTVTRGTFRAKGDSALGSTAGTTTCVCTKTDGAYDNLIYFDGLTTSETIYLSRGDVGWSWDETIFFTADCTFNGLVASPAAKMEYGWFFADGITLTFNGGFGSSDRPFGSVMGMEDAAHHATVVFNASPCVNGNWYWMNAVTEMNAPVSGDCQFRFRGGTYHLNVADCFAQPSPKRVLFESAAALELNLTEGGQRFAYFSAEKDNSAASVFTSETGQTVSLENASYDSLFRGVFSGNVNFSVAGSKTVTLSGASKTSGTLSLSDTAKIVFASGGVWTGALAFESGDGAQTVTLDNGGMTVTALYVAGEKMPDGTYGAAGSGAETVLSCLAGDGVLQVKTPMSTLTVEASTATYEVAAEGEAYSSVTVLGNTTFTGGALTVSGGSVTAAAGTTVCFENAVVFDGAYGVSLSPASGATLDFRGAVSGPADLEILAADKTGVVRFAPGDGVTNDFDGALTVTRGTFRAKGDSALGSTAGTTTCVCTMTDGAYDNRIYFDGLTTSETIYLSRGTIGWTSVSTVFFTADCTFNGPVMPLAGTRQQEHGWSLADGITLTFNAPLGTAEKPYGNLVGDNDGTLAAKTVFNASPYCADVWYWKVGDVDLYAPIRGNNQWYLRGGHYRLYVADALVNDDGVSGNIRFETADPLVFDLVAGDQRVNCLFEKTSGYSTASEITSSTGCRFRLCGTSPSVFAGRFTGNVDVAVEAAQTLTLSGASTSTGTLALTNGAHVVFTDAGDWAGRIDVAGNGNETLTVNGRIRASAVTYGGEPLAPGYYGPDAPVEANRPAWLLGAGELVVTDTVGTGVWDAEGGEANLRMSSAVNWAEDEVPDGARGLTAVTFADAGTAAWIDQDVFWKAIAFSSTVPAFRLFGEGVVTLADGVTAAAPSGDSAAYEIAAPVRPYGAQTWTVPAATTLTLSGGLFGGDGERDLTLSGAGAFVFAGEAGDFRSDITVTEAASVRADSAAAFGSPEGVTKIAGTGALVLNDVTLAEPFVWSGTDASRGTFITLKPGTNVLAGPVSVENAVYFNGQSNGDRLVFSGGLDFSGMKNTGRKRFTFGWRGNAARANPFTVEIKDRPIVNDGPRDIEFYNECVCDVVVSVAGNRLTGTSATRSKIQMTRNDKNAAGEPTARLLCKVPYAFAYTDDLLLGVDVCNEGMAYCGLIDLCGNDQGFAAAYGLAEAYQAYVVDGKPQGAHSVVTSSGGPALLCSRHAEDAETWWTFTGAAGYRMEGTGGITFRTSSLSTGVLCVTNGTMTLPAGVSWRACTKAEVSGDGTLVLEHDGALGGRTEMRISENGRVHLPAGVSARAGSLVLEDGEARLGEWGSPESGAANVNACFTGTGRIRFGSTMAIIIR